jgi:hypothetical protein
MSHAAELTLLSVVGAQAATLRWAKIAGWAGIASVILTAFGIAIGFWMAK